MSSADPSILKTISRLRNIRNKCSQVDESSLRYRFKIPQCGRDALVLLEKAPRKARELAEIKLRSLPKAQMTSSSWSSLYIESTLQIVIELVAGALLALVDHARRETGEAHYTDESQSSLPEEFKNTTVYSVLDNLLSQVAEVLDRAILLTEIPSELLPWTHDTLQNLRIVAKEIDTKYSIMLNQPPSKGVAYEWSPYDKLLKPANLPTAFPAQSKDTHPPIKFPVETLTLTGRDDLNQFTAHLGSSHFNRNNCQGPLPVVILNGMQSWTHRDLWQDPSYLMELTLGGRRMVPVEIGKSYTDLDWTQRLMSFREFLVQYMLPEGIIPTKERGYLAQHNLFRQIPALESNVSEPILCYSDPPHPGFPDPKPIELIEAEKSLSENVEKNIWIGPAQTISPAHTDPYHNIFSQIVGYKYVRLYPPSEKAKMYPMGSENGINMSNTSRVDVAQSMRAHEGWYGWDESDEIGDYDIKTICQDLDREFPMLKQAKYLETIIEPDQMLFIPKGWFHYVRSLSTSISVSFWWK